MVFPADRPYRRQEASRISCSRQIDDPGQRKQSVKEFEGSTERNVRQLFGPAQTYSRELGMEFQAGTWGK